MIKMIIFILFLFISIVHAKSMNVSRLTINCGDLPECQYLKEDFRSLIRTYVDQNHLDEVLKLYTINEGIKNFYFKIFELKNKEYALDISLVPKEKVLDVDVKFIGAISIVPEVLPVKKDDFFDSTKVEKTKVMLRGIYVNKGYPHVNITTKIKHRKTGLSLIFNVQLNTPVTVTKLSVFSKSLYLKEILNRKMSVYLNRPFDLQDLKNNVEVARQLFIDYGFYQNEIKIKFDEFKTNKIKVRLEILQTDTFVFRVKSKDENESIVELKEFLKESTIAYKSKISVITIEQLMMSKMREMGFLNPHVEVSKREYKNKSKDQVHHYDLKLDKGLQSKLDRILFKGNSLFNEDELKELFYENASDKASLDIFDEEYYKNYLDLLRKKYIEKGYVNVFMESPLHKILPKSKKIILTFRIREGAKAIVRNIDIVGLEAESEILEKFYTKIKTMSSEPFNPIAFKEDLRSIKAIMRDEGYFYGEIENESAQDLVVYQNDNTQVNITIRLVLRKKLFVNEVIIIGNNRTRSKIIRREISFKTGDIITAKSISDSQTNLIGLGLFSSVNIKPIENRTNQADILISLREKDFGIIELAPGIRTDMGLKLSTNISYSNIDGLDKKISFKGHINQRFNLNSLDDTRRKSSSSLLEYSSVVNYSENHLFDTDVATSVSLSKSRIRYYSFDADIQKIGYTLSKNFTNWFNFSFKQQIETISQFDATATIDHGHFQIGSITPSMTFDFRNNDINPTSGAFFNLSCEFANPNFLSQSNDELVINYYKLINRNRLYIPFKNGTFAISMAAGVQKNLADKVKSDGSTEGYIPSIKVFRLAGMDNVRGFEDNEINRLISQDDISEVVVDDVAYMANIKIEPRFFLSDTTMLGVFYDAGRVFVDSYDLGKLRSSVGVSFKYLTPVGSLDFDYGIKLLRNRDADGILDAPGRLHVSIGFF